MDKKIIAYIKALGLDMIQKAGSGHPGIVLGAAPILYTLYAKHLNFNTNDTKWINRDRFVLSAGHGSALLYAILYMVGFDISLEDLQSFRRIGSKTPGHPEWNKTPGVEASTGVLGQGFANAVGMALAGKKLETAISLPTKKRFEKKRHLFNYRVYALVSDGDMMEGITNEAASLAGSLQLNNLIVLYDSNHISLDGETKHTFTENVLAKFQAMGWNTILVKNGENVDEISKAIEKAKQAQKPTLIECQTVLGHGSKWQGTNRIHGNLLTPDDYRQVKQILGLENHQPFYVPKDILDHIRNEVASRNNASYLAWAERYKEYVEMTQGDLSKLEFLKESHAYVDLLNLEWKFDSQVKEATRKTNTYVLDEIAARMPQFIGGSADLATSTNTYLASLGDCETHNYDGRNIWFGVREQAMGGILNGLALSKYRVYGSTFLVFADYVKPSIRLAALMHLPVTFIFTHDSISIGQDGPTHQPIEQLAMLRSIPNVALYRPCDAHELVGSWDCILKTHDRPSILILGRNEVNLLPTTNQAYIQRGAYIVRQEKGTLHGIIIATGSEVQLSYFIAEELYRDFKLDLRVVSIPCKELFEIQSQEYQNELLPKQVKRIVIEAGSSFGWHAYVDTPNHFITLEQFGISGTKEEVLHYCRFDYLTIKERIITILQSEK